MPIEEYVWSLVAPLGFRNQSYADSAAFQTDILAGNVQDPRIGMRFLLTPTGTAKHPFEIVETHNSGSLTSNFTIRRIAGGAAVGGFTTANYFMEGQSRAVTDTDGATAFTFARPGIQNVFCILNDGRSAFLTVNAGSDLLPVNSAVPVISGTVQVGQTLTATQGTWTNIPPGTFTRQWLRNGSIQIAGATNATYVPTASDVGATLSHRVTATNTGGVVNAVSANTIAVAA